MILAQNPKFHSYRCMLNDEQRHLWYRRHIQSVVKDRVFLDVGTGTGVLAAYALESGAQHGYALDFDTLLAKRILNQIGYGDRVTYVNRDFMQVNANTFDRTVEVIIAEQVGPRLFDQIQVDIWRQAHTFAAVDYISIPDELAVDLYVYNGDISNSVIDNLIAYSDTLPTGFYEAARQYAYTPSQIIKQAISITAANCFDPITCQVTVDQTSTVVFYNKMGFRQDYLDIAQSFTQPWYQMPYLVLEAGTHQLTCVKTTAWLGEWSAENVS